MNKVRKAAIVAQVCLALSLAACSSANKEFDEVLGKFEEVVVVYESYIKKDPFCVEYINQINSEVLVKLNDLGAKAKQIRENGPQPTKEQLERYAKVSARMSNTMLALGNRMKDAQICGGNPFGALTPAVPAAAVPAPAAVEPPPAPAAVPAPEPAAPAPQAISANRPGRAEDPVAAPPVAARPSFDCAAASNATEKLICGSPMLSDLDSRMASAYKSARAASANPDALKAEQLAWIKQSRKCADETCLKEAYQTRIADLSR